jgi:hypothetical protein
MSAFKASVVLLLTAGVIACASAPREPETAIVDARLTSSVVSLQYASLTPLPPYDVSAATGGPMWVVIVSRPGVAPVSAMATIPYATLEDRTYRKLADIVPRLRLFDCDTVVGHVLTCIKPMAGRVALRGGGVEISVTDTAWVRRFLAVRPDSVHLSATAPGLGPRAQATVPVSKR